MSTHDSVKLDGYKDDITVAVCVVLILSVAYYSYRYYLMYKSTFVTLRQHIFPFQIEDMSFDHIKDGTYIKKILKHAYRKPEDHEVEFLVKYKKFCDHKDSFSLAREPEIDFITKILPKIKNVPGDIAEFGVWKGGMAMWIQAIMIYHGMHVSKRLFLFDAFGKFPAPKKNNCHQDTKLHPITTFLFENSDYDVETIQKNFERFQLMKSNVVFVPGLFDDTCPNKQIKKLALLRLDCDYYEPTLHILNSHYFDISPGGILLIDDFNNQYVGCRQAILDFRKKHNINIPIIEDNTAGCVYWQIH